MTFQNCFSTLILVGLVLVYSSSAIEAARPNFLTEEDFTRARLLPSVLPENGTFLNLPPQNEEQNFPETKNAWKHDKWPNARIPYTLDPNFNNDQRAQVAKAIENYHSKTCVRFVRKESGDKDYVEILRDDNTCGLANVCRSGGAQFAKFGGGCITSGVMTHELGHTLCFGHEQSRSDRDNFIDWDTKKCEPHGIDNANEWTTLDLLYDYVSLQHYEGECYSGCIKPKIPGVTKCGSGGDLSVLDVEKINAYYNCPGCQSYRFRPISKVSKSENMVVAGKGVNGEVLYPCRFYYNGDIIVGKGDPAWPSCHGSYNGREYEANGYFEILTNPRNANLKWIRRPADGSFPANAIRGGRSAEREPFYIGRCTLKFKDGKSTTIPGKIHRSASSNLYVAYGGQEHQCADYEILVC